jgi:hypothetical protein
MKPRRVVRDSLALLAPSLKELAPQLSVSYAMLRRIATGARPAPAPVFRALARLLRRHARALAKEAERLDKAQHRTRRGDR